MKEENIDCRKHRKSTHLASADLDVLILEKKSLIFTIDKVWYETGVDVSGNKTDAYFCKLKEHKKHLILNSVNRKTLSSFAKINGFENEEIYNIGNWKGMLVEFFVDRNVKMMGKIVDGIRIQPLQPKKIKVLPEFTSANFEKAFNAKATIEKIKTVYTVDAETEKLYLAYGTEK